MESNNPFLLIDKALEWFAMDIDDMVKGAIIPRTAVTKEQAISDIFEKFKGDLTIDEMAEFGVYEEPIFSELLHRGFIQKKGELYSITFQGKLFSRQGGFAGEQNRQNIENIRLDMIERNQKVHRRWMTGLTLILAVGTSVAAWYYLIEIWKFYYCR